ncbi:hypothetical protein DBV15_07245 [Temnothorax longispinosus]|uniref:Uncharacterized protein n=1 Tax=Temnothorax longispinosus TaxID=300112 RepID=A0A4S2JJ84_9HYME|nr:hypothetical protein DBV15_07245 [Temnothorax longispinosus]
MPEKNSKKRRRENPLNYSRTSPRLYSVRIRRFGQSRFNEPATSLAIIDFRPSRLDAKLFWKCTERTRTGARAKSWAKVGTSRCWKMQFGHRISFSLDKSAMEQLRERDEIRASRGIRLITTGNVDDDEESSNKEPRRRIYSVSPKRNRGNTSAKLASDRRNEHEDGGGERVTMRRKMPKDGRGSFKRLRTRRSRCERELPVPGWRVCGTAIMGQLVSYRGSSVRGRKVHPVPLLAKIGNNAREQLRSVLRFAPRRTELSIHAEDAADWYEESALDILDTRNSDASSKRGNADLLSRDPDENSVVLRSSLENEFTAVNYTGR